MINSGNNIKSWINYVVRSNKLNLTDNCKAKLLEEELTSQQKHKSHEDNLWELEEERLREQQQKNWRDNGRNLRGNSHILLNDINY